MCKLEEMFFIALRRASNCTVGVPHSQPKASVPPTASSPCPAASPRPTCLQLHRRRAPLPTQDATTQIN